MSIETNPLYTGQKLAWCKTCQRAKKPLGRDASVDADLCDRDCPGWFSDPFPKDLWPGERREDFGFPADLAAEARELRAKENGQ